MIRLSPRQTECGGSRLMGSEMETGKRTKMTSAIEKLLEQSSLCEHWMTTKVYTVEPSDSAAYACTLLRQHRINQLPVVNGGKLLGIVTDRDLRQAAGATERPEGLEGIRVQTIMSSPPITLGAHSTLVNAAEVM